MGIEKFAFDIWGDSVNFSSRMESAGAPNRISISGTNMGARQGFSSECEHRGRISTKDKRDVDMYFVNGILPSLLDGSDVIPPPLFTRRYRTYFEHDPPAFPGFLGAPETVGAYVETSVVRSGLS